MRGTDPIKSRWECLRIVMFVAMCVELKIFFSAKHHLLQLIFCISRPPAGPSRLTARIPRNPSTT